MLILFSALSECEPSLFPRTLYPEDSAQSQFFSQTGINTWFKGLLNDGSLNISGQQLPDMITSLNLGVTKIDVFFTDIVVAEFEVQDVKFLFMKSRTFPLNLVGARFVLRLNWKIQQTSYPYMTDHGTGKVIVSDTDFSTICGAECDYDVCPNHLLAQILHAELKIGVLKVVLEGGTSWMYQSMINLVLGVVSTEIQKLLSYYLSNDVVDVINSIMQAYTSHKNLETDSNIIKDERFISDLVIDDGYAYILFSGYTYSALNTSDEYITQNMLNPNLVINKFNAPMQMTISEAGFNNLFYIHHKYENSYSNDLFQLNQPPLIEFQNSAAILNLDLTLNSTTVQLKLIGLPVFFNNAHESKKFCVFFRFSAYEIQPGPEINKDELLQTVIPRINDAMEKAPLVLINSKMYHAEDFECILDSVDKVIRIVHK
ncbi:Conserved_hypothetical protein [Hexamita inflata]|uniref:Uncharacterized protein n=1 Tax=Hexamita inflata TaxID=28002 RepID=A0AA86NXU9_9EUKA|nr:Conserved hypothetical protein [Hexamita inflata]